MPLKLAVIGSGPAGCYAVEQLARLAPEAEIDVIDRLPTPYGLVRAGVAPDHQGTKSVERVLERALTRPNVAFHGNVEIGRDLDLDALRALYDAVILAIGAPLDRCLGIPGEDLSGVHPSGAFTRWINGHPDDSDRAVRLDHARSVVVIGNGNVAIDVARVLAKTPEEMARSDLAPFIEAAIARAPLAEIHIVGRRGPGETSFTAVELEEMARLARAHPVVIDDAGGADALNPAALAILRRFATLPDPGKPVRIHFHFHLKPLRFEGEGRLERGRFARQRFDGGGYAPTGETVAIPADLAVTCIGYSCRGCGVLAPENRIFRNEHGRIGPGLYVVGWAKRGPTGTIPTNRTESHAVAERLIAETAPGGKPGRAAFLAVLRERGITPVDFAGWQRVNTAEKTRAAAGRAREKLRSLPALLAAARG